jgi:hypothetical protein
LVTACSRIVPTFIAETQPAVKQNSAENKAIQRDKNVFSVDNEFSPK